MAMRLSPLRISLLYAAFGASWIVISDSLWYFSGFWFQVAKGVGFVVATSALIYLLTWRALESLSKESAAARRSQQQFQQLVEHAPIGIYLQTGGHFTYVNPEGLRLFGSADPRELEGKEIVEFVHPEYREVVAERVRTVIDRREAVPIQPLAFLRPDGKPLDVEESAVPVEADGVRGAITYVQDISGRTEREALYKKLAELIPAMVWVTDGDGTVQYLNSQFFEYTGLSRAGSEPTSWLAPVHPADLRGAEEAWAAAISVSVDFEARLRFRRKDGEYRWFSVHAVAASLGDTIEPRTWFGTCVDIHDPIRLVEGINTAVEAERMRLSRELHDDIGQSLVAVKLNLELGILHDDEERLTKAARDITACVQRVRELSAGLRPSELKAIGILDSIESLCQEWSYSSGISCGFSSNAKIWDVDERVALGIYRIVQEALNNVAKHARAQSAQVSLEFQDQTVAVKVRDNGSGIDEVLKPSGIGLLSMKERASALGGYLSVTSEPARGTLVHCVLPAGSWSA